MPILSHDTRAFLRAAWRRPFDVGAIAPSSAALCRLMVDDLDLGDDHGVVIELGCGTGALTRQIDARLARPERYLGVERDAEFVDWLDEEYPHLRFVRGDAQHVTGYLRDVGLDDVPVSAILSALPLSSLPDDVQQRLIDVIDGLMRPGVVFRTIHCLCTWWMPNATAFRRRMDARFGRHEMVGRVLHNVPPACVLSWSRD